MQFNRVISKKALIVGLFACAVFAAPPDAPHSGQACPGNAGKTACVKPDSLKKNVSMPDKEILFFMNPNGHPCQMQLAILDSMKTKLAPLATIKYIKTTEPGDENMFNNYGIRGLPSLIIIDKSGKEIKRFTPGIQDEKAILAALGKPSK
ncbi:MAG: thioredoxin family protein [Chitinivibrionales bacterium]|nr:thioredoxin family protein [Chitinivibrionales bacterium]